MFRAKGWAARAVLLAGMSVGGWTFATAAEPMMLPPGMPSAAAPSTSTTHVTLESRDVEMMVEIELLADPATFPHTIKATMGEKGLDLKGFVPNETIKKRAVAIATNLFPSVNDQLLIQPNLTLPAPITATTSFVSDAGKRIAQVNPRAANRVDVKTSTNGTITLTGKVDSLSEKWKMSVALRNLAGCMAIKNNLEAPNAPMFDRDAVMAPSMPSVPGQAVQAIPIEKGLPKTVMPPVEVSKTVMPPVEVSKPIMPLTNKSKPPAPLLPVTMPPEADEPKLPLTAPGKPLTKTPGNPVGLTKSPYGGETTATVPPAVEKKPHEMPKAPVAPAKAPSEAKSPVEAKHPAAVKSPAAVKPSSPTKAEGGAPAIITFDDEPVATPKPPAVPVKSVGGSVEGPVGGVVPAPAGTAKAMPTGSAKPMPAGTAKAMPSAMANLQKQVKANLGTAAKEVAVEVGEKGGYVVTVVHQPGFEAGAMFQMIKHLPELNDGKTSVEFRVAD